MKKRRKTIRRKLKTTVKANSLRAEANDGYFEEESNMRLSRAFVVVLILHVVAVGGILLFNNLKAQHETGANQVLNDINEQPSEVAEPHLPGTSQAAVSRQPELIHKLGSGDTLSKLSRKYGVSVKQIVDANNLQSASVLRVGQELVIPVKEQAGVPTLEPSAAVRRVSTASSSSPAATSTPPTESIPSSGTYTVVKGDNPHAIARRFGVDYKALLEINNIEDPRLLQIGQILKLPPKE